MPCEAEQSGTPVTFRTASVTVQNPLRTMPSVLAMRDVQPRVHQVLSGSRLGEDEMVAVLQLDPLAVLRGLRATNAPVFRTSTMTPSVRGIVRSLGQANSRRLLACPPVDVPLQSPLRTLWMRALATAIAAADLAEHSHLLDGEAAYLIGLLADLPQWLQTLRAGNAGNSSLQQVASMAECLAQWQLPTALATVMRNASLVEAENDMAWLPTDATSLVSAARRLATLAGHPNHGAAPGPAPTDRADRDAVERIRGRLSAALQAFGLDGQPLGVVQPGAMAPLMDGNRHGSLDEMVLGILGCARSDSYRGIITALTSAALRYGGYDRVFYARWLPKAGTLTLRSKADASSRRIVTRRLTTTAAESRALQTALAEDRPVRLEALMRTTTGLLLSLSADELMAVPLNSALQQPSFLLLDRSLTLAPIDLECDRSMAITLGMTGSLLIENLLLRRRRQRAQKFALTDPLTRLYNRRMGLLSLEQEMARSERSQRPVSVLMCDLDHFKQLNDTHGHLQGDHALRATSDVLRSTLRKGDTICRLGGEEFLVVLPDTPPSDATVLAARLFTAVQRRGEELGLPITVSIGLTAFRLGDTVEAILHRADKALYASKGHGRNRFSVDLEPSDELTPLPK